MMKSWENLPKFMRTQAVFHYYDSLSRKPISLLAKTVFDRIMALILLLALSPILIGLSIAIKMDSPGPVFFRQKRVTQYGRVFYIYKFRTMVQNAEALGAQVTTQSDSRITKIGSRLRHTRLDELPQVINILLGDMSFVGTRPEVPKYVEQYTDSMKATLLLPAGVTSRASIAFKDEEQLLANAEDVDITYVTEVLPRKMKWNLESLENFSFWGDITTMIDTVVAVLQ